MSDPFPGGEVLACLEARAAEAAAQAGCSRCKAVILEEGSLIGLVFVRMEAVATRQKDAVQLCGKCGLLLREFLRPERLDDPRYQAAADLLRRTWG